MVTTQPGHITRNQQELSIRISNISFLTSSQGQPKYIMASAPDDGFQYPYLATLDLSISEHLNLYNKAIFGLPEMDRYDLTRSKWTEFYQELEDYVSTFGFNTPVLIVTSRYGGHVPTEFKDIILLYLYITQFMVDSHCEILWDENSEADLGLHPTENHASGLDDK